MVEDVAGLGTLLASDDAGPLELVHYPARTVVADAKTPLHITCRCALFFHNNGHSLIIKGINVSVMLGRLGVPNVAFGFVGGFTGNEISRLLRREGVNTSFVRVGGLSRINVKLHADRETQFNGSGPEIGEKELASRRFGRFCAEAGGFRRSLPIFESLMGYKERSISFTSATLWAMAFCSNTG